jgi:hypothetical protein
MKQELLRLKKQMQWMRLYVLISITAIIVCIISAFSGAVKKTGIIRASGIVIEDSSGRDRILIGAPIPFSKDRVRTDTNRVRKFWAKEFEEDAEKYMDWYKNYYHGAEGIVIMNENGFDRVLLGDKLADPNTGRRMFEPAGILWNDKEGWELGGAGVNTTKDGKSRSVIGVDDKDGEAVHIIALEDGTKGLVIGGENGRLLIGMSKKNGQWFQNREAFTGVKYFDSNGKLVWEQQMKK